MTVGQSFPEFIEKDSSSFLQETYARYWSELCAYIAKNFGAGPPEPEDVAQIAFARFAEQKDSKNIRNPRAYLYASARNYLIDEKRRSRRVEAYADDFRVVSNSSAMSDFSPERVLIGKERFAIFAKALKGMPATKRRLVLLNRFEGISCKQLAQRFGMSEAAVQKQIERALADCLRALNKAEQQSREKGKTDHR